MAAGAGFAEFASSRHGALYRYAYLLAGERGLAEDLVQEGLTKTYVAWGRLRDPGNAEAYTRKAITTIAISWWRRKAWRAERPRNDVPDRPMESHDATARIWLWHELRQRAALVLRYYEDLTEVRGTSPPAPTTWWQGRPTTGQATRPRPPWTCSPSRPARSSPGATPATPG
ncbi:sigma factor [Kribbella sp. VKM Ac-2568]|uniref:sigma factor n=1 Tax=Kribbella sp. VKM Ac-2568 TaxID=2512219 RepID=UPI0010503C3D|nr:sigma factor [Kribbella sp. VKM Ac-2568]TCM42543.1 RNA polymerase sigma factor (sigma-70 family) [Kribbella sp. VKM Ac-2568]